MSDLAQSRGATAPADDTVTWDDVRKLVALTLVVAWLGFFLFTGMPQLTLEVFPRTLTTHILVGVVAALYLVWLAVARRLPGGTPFDLPVLALLAAYAIATYASVNWRVSLEGTLLFGAAIIAFYALSDLPFLTAQQLRRALMLLAAGLSLYAVWIVGNDYANYLSYVRSVEGLDSGNIFPPTVPRVHGVSDHPNMLAMLLTIFMPFFALNAYRASSRIERIAGFAGFAIAALAIFLTLSRGGWLGVFAGTSFTLVAAFMTVRAFDREQQGFKPSWENAIPRDINPTAIATILGALVLAAGGTLAFLSSSTTRPGWLFRSSLSPREDAWRAGLDMFADFPLAGSGPNTFGILYPQYSGRFLVHTQHAHNGFLQAANDIGIIGLLALAALGVTVFYVLLKTWREGALEQRLLAVACAGGLIGFSIHNQLDAGNIWKAPAFSLALVGAIMVRNYRERANPAPAASAAWFERVPERVRKNGPLAARALIVVLIVLPFIAWYRIDTAHYDYWRAIDLSNKNDPSALARMQDAVNADSSMMVYQLELGKMQAEEYISGRRTDQALIESAVIHLEQAVRHDKRSDLARINLARAYQLAGRDEDAAREAQVTRLAVHHVPPVLAAAEVYELLGAEYEDEAIATYGQVISMDAGLADSPFWDGSDFRKEHYEEIVGASILGINPCTLGSFLVQRFSFDPTESIADLGDAETGCKILVVNSPNDLIYRAALARIFMQRGNFDQAKIHLEYAVNKQPDFGPVRTEYGRWYALQGDTESAKHQWLIGGQLEEAESILLLGETYPTGQVPADLIERLSTLLGNSGTSIRNDTISILYYRLRYARTSPLRAIIGGEWQTAVPRIYSDMSQRLEEWRFEARTGVPARPEASPTATN